MRTTLDAFLLATLAAGFVVEPLVVAHLAAVLLVLLAFCCPWRVASVRLVAAVGATVMASARLDAPLREVAVQLPFVYGVSGLVILLADQVRRARATSERAYEQARHLALFDALTNLPNRTLLDERLTKALAARADGSHVALVVLDLDRFKEVNDSFGHAAGDELLRQIGARLASALRETDTVARLGGDEFAVVLPGADVSAAKEIAAALRHALARRFAVQGQALDVGGSFGIAVAPDDGEASDGLLQHADIAMYAAKRMPGSCAVYDPHEEDNAAERLALMAELRGAIECDELILHYQPIVDARTGEPRSFEALLRWRHPVRGMVPPAHFIALAERSGLIRDLSLWVLEAGIRQARVWRDAGIVAPVSLNLSMRNLLDPELPDALAVLIARAGIDPGLLTLEITEGALMADQERAARTVARLRELGLHLAIDDFGSGYSSLAYLSRLAVDEVKIDRSFVAGMADDVSCAAIVRATLELAHTLGFTVVAEGVEDEAIRALLVAAGVDGLQGYLFGRPVPAAEIPVWLSQRSQALVVA